MKPVFKEADINDFESNISFVYKFYDILPDDPIAKNLQRSITELLNNPHHGKCWLIKITDENAGYIVITFGFSIEYNGRDIFIDEFFINEPYRNKGIGKAALNFVSEYAAENNIKAVHLEVKEKHSQAAALYEREGFEKHNSIFMTKVINQK